MNQTTIRTRVCLAALILLLPIGVGCATFNPPQANTYESSLSIDQSTATKSEVAKGWDKTSRFLTGREQVDKEKSKLLYNQANALFVSASERYSKDSPKATRDDFYKAGGLFSRAADAFPGSALQQDAFFMAGESYYFADHLTKAEDAYVTLQKEHPRNRHSQVVGGRLFTIAQYWIDTEMAGVKDWTIVNFTDPTRPYLDSSGHAIRVFDQMRYDDPTGKLADDATMAAAMEHMRNHNYLEADQMYTDLREIYPDSDHQFNAHMLGIRCKMLMYAGPDYPGVVLEDADKLIERARRIFPSDAAKPDNADYLAKASAEIEYRLAEKLWKLAIYREKQQKYGGANFYLQELLEKFPETPFAEKAREHMAINEKLPELPPQRLAFLTKIFPAARPEKPLMANDGQLLR